MIPAARKEQEAYLRTRQPEQPRLTAAAAGAPMNWPEVSLKDTPQEISIFLSAVGERNVLSYEKELRLEEARQRSRESYYRQRAEKPEELREKERGRKARQRARTKPDTGAQ